MLKNIKNLTGVTTLSKEEQKALKGGMVLCPPGLYLVVTSWGNFCVTRERVEEFKVKF